MALEISDMISFAPAIYFCILKWEYFCPTTKSWVLQNHNLITHFLDSHPFRVFPISSWFCLLRQLRVEPNHKRDPPTPSITTIPSDLDLVDDYIRRGSSTRCLLGSAPSTDQYNVLHVFRKRIPRIGWIPKTNGKIVHSARFWLWALTSGEISTESREV